MKLGKLENSEETIKIHIFDHRCGRGVTTLPRVRSPVGSVFLAEVSSEVVPQLQDKCQENLGSIHPRISLAIIIIKNHSLRSLLFIILTKAMYYIYGQRPSPSVHGCYMVWMIYGHIITGDECGPNFLTFILWLRKSPGKPSTRKLTQPGIEPGSAAWKVTLLPLEYSGGPFITDANDLRRWRDLKRHKLYTNNTVHDTWSLAKKKNSSLGPQ